MAKRGWIVAVAAGILGFSVTAGTLLSLNLPAAALFGLSMLARAPGDSVLAVFAHRTLAAESASQVLRGMLSGLYSFAAFFFVLSWTLSGASLFVSYGCAVVAALAVQGIAFRRLKS